MSSLNRYSKFGRDHDNVSIIISVLNTVKLSRLMLIKVNYTLIFTLETSIGKRSVLILYVRFQRYRPQFHPQVDKKSASYVFSACIEVDLCVAKLCSAVDSRFCFKVVNLLCEINNLFRKI